MNFQSKNKLGMSFKHSINKYFKTKFIIIFKQKMKKKMKNISSTL